MSRLQLYRVVISVLGMMVCALGVALFVTLNRPPVQVVRETAAVPHIQTPAPLIPVSEPATPNFPPSAASPPSRVFVPKSVDIVRLQALQKKFEVLSTQKEPSLDEADALLNELIDIQGSSVIAGVDLNVVRQNLRIAGDLQQVAKEMETEQKKPTPDAAEMENLRQRAADLQNQLAASLHGQPTGAAPSAGPVRR
jgi:hypothetical protein